MLRLSTKARYGVRALSEIARRKDTRPVRLREVATEQGISEKYLEQIIMILKQAGLVRGIRGAGGGYLLTRTPGEITLLNVVEAVDGPIRPVPCLDGDICDREDICAAKDVWNELYQHIVDYLSSMTIEELAVQTDKKAGRAIEALTASKNGGK